MTQRILSQNLDQNPLLNIFPVSLTVTGKKALIIGNGEGAIGRCRLLQKTEADIHIVAPHPHQVLLDFANEHHISLLETSFDPLLLDKTSLVFITDDLVEDERLIDQLQATNIPLNVMDVPEKCSFYVPAMIDRAPISIAISTGGAAPVFASLMRTRIERLLPREMGSLVKLAGSIRTKMIELIPDHPSRRHFLNELLFGSATNKAIKQGPPQARRATIKLLDRYGRGKKSKGFISLIDVSAMDVDLLSLKAARALEQADHLIYSHDTSPAMLELARRDAQHTKIEEFDHPLLEEKIRQCAGNGEHIVCLAALGTNVSTCSFEMLLEQTGIAHEILLSAQSHSKQVARRAA